MINKLMQFFVQYVGDNKNRKLPGIANVNWKRWI